MMTHIVSTQIVSGFLLAILFGGLVHSGCSGSAPYDASPDASRETASALVSASAPGQAPPGSMANQYPRIVPREEKSGSVKSRFRFSFEGETVKLDIKIRKSVLEGAKHANKYAISVAGNEDRDWREKYNLAFIDDAAQAPILDELHQKLLKIAKQKKLDKDRTVELLTAFVQHIEYDDTKADMARFPVETLAEEKGDCDDKSRLLVALLTRSGFNVATLHFNSENHMAVGIKSNGLEYRKTGYSYIETTSPSLIGFPFSENADVQLHTVPTVQRIGSGKKRYGASKDVSFISNTLRSLEKEIARDQKEMNKLNDRCHSAAKTLQTLEREMKDTAPPANQLVRQYNRAVDTYNGYVKKQQKHAKALNQKIELRNFIVNNVDTRYTTVKAIRQKLKQIQ